LKSCAQGKRSAVAARRLYNVGQNGENNIRRQAKALKNRVGSIFYGDHEPKTQAMISKIDNFDVIIAKRIQALVLRIP
jgi:hypothetical protein